MTDSQELVDLAKWAEQTERYDDMAEYMKELTQKGEELSDEQRNLLSVAFKNVVGAKRSAWRIISSIEQRAADGQGDGQGVAAAKEYREEIQKELQDRCREVLELIAEYLLKTVAADTGNPTEAKVFYLKMKGDYYRYLVEVTTDEKRAGLSKKTEEAYSSATAEAAVLPSTNPIKLGLALNFSVFYYEIKNDGKLACELAKTAFDNATAELDDLKGETYKDSTTVMQLLRDNLTLWLSENENDGDA